MTTIRSTIKTPARIAPPTGKKSAPAAPALAGPIAKLAAIRDWANARVVGRTKEINLLTLALASKSNVLLLGVPGTAKTMLVDLMSRAFCPAPGDFFDILMTKFTKPAEVFGPTDVVALRDESTLRVSIDGFLPTAKTAALDEVFKASSAILNALLRIANERKFRNGPVWIDCPCRMIVGMSNEFPEDPSTLAAFYDRFPLKMMVDSLDDTSFGDMLRLVRGQITTGKPPVTLTDADFVELDRLVSAVVIPDGIIEVLGELRGVLRAKGIRPSDRRWAQCVRIVRASAALAGRSTAVRVDLQAIEPVMWSTQEEIGQVRAEIVNFLNPIEKVLREAIDGAWSGRRLILDAAGPNNDSVAAATAATKAITTVRQQEALLQIVESKMVETDDDREKLALARSSIEMLKGAVEAVCLGKPDALAKIRQIDAPSVG